MKDLDETIKQRKAFQIKEKKLKEMEKSPAPLTWSATHPAYYGTCLECRSSRESREK